MHDIIWKQVLLQLEKKLDGPRFETWFKPLVPLPSSDDSIFTIGAPNSYVKDFVEQFYLQNLLSHIQQFAPSIKEVSIEIAAKKSPAVFTEPVVTSQKSGNHVPTGPIPRPILNDRFTFDSFVVGSGNEFAKSAAFAVAEAPGKTKFNPLLIYGGVGLGKTHLLQAIGNYLISLDSGYKITYITSEEFYLNFIDAIKNNNTKDFTANFRTSDALLMDDVQFFSGKESTQEEFFFIFNTLYQNGKQIVLTSDLPPASLKGLQDRLISRFQWGLCVDIQPPNLETRVAILKKKAEEGNLNISQNVLYYIAETISSNIRELEGIVIRLLAFASITKSDITLDLVKSMIKGSSSQGKSRVTIDEIIDIVADYYKIPVNNIREKNRRKEVAHARQVAMYIAKSITNYSLKSIGLNFGGRDHSTVIHAISQIEQQKESDNNLSRDINYMISLIES